MEVETSDCLLYGLTVVYTVGYCNSGTVRVCLQCPGRIPAVW